MDIIFSVAMLLISITLGCLIRKRIIPPISNDYITGTPKQKERLRNDKDAIAMISNIFFMLGACFFTALLAIIFSNIKAFRYLTIILFIFMVIYGIYKGISYEIHRDT